MIRPKSSNAGLMHPWNGLVRVTVPIDRLGASNNHYRGRMSVQDLTNPPAPLKLYTASRWASRRMKVLKNFVRFSVPVLLVAGAVSASAAQLTGDARAAIPHDVQQLVVIDYRAMQNSSTAMQLRDRVMPPDLKQFEE